MTTTPSLPDAPGFLAGTAPIKPLQHTAQDVTRFARGFESLPLSNSGAARLVQLGEMMQHPQWYARHDAAHNAIHTAQQFIATQPPEEIAGVARMVETLSKARAPDADTVKGITHPVLQETLKPLVTYLEEFNAFLIGWAKLTPSQLRPKEGEASTTLAALRPNLSFACADPVCTVDHGAASSPSTPHVHGVDCGHSFSSAEAEAAHVASNKPNIKGWIAGVVAAVGLGAYLIHKRRAGTQEAPDSPHPNWQERSRATTPPGERTP